LGGSDKYGITKKIVYSFSQSTHDFDLTIVLGKFFHDENLMKIIKNDNRFHVIKNPPSLVSFMQQSIVGIVTFGITVYEAAMCGLPLFVISHSNENHFSARLVEKYGWIYYLGKYDLINYDILPNTMIKLMQNKTKLKQMRKACLQIDGLGPTRVAKYIINL